MIISHKHKFIFIKTQKTAGTSLEIALSEFCGPEDVITPITKDDEAYRKELGFPGSQNYHIPLSKYNKRDWFRLLYHQRRAAFYNHVSATQIMSRIDPGIWDSYFTFSFERNPYDKVVSFYYWMKDRSGAGSILEFLKSGEASSLLGFDLYAINSQPVVDKVYKYEEMSPALEHISERLNLPGQLALPRRKAKGNVREDKRHYRDILSQEEVEIISKIYAREIAYYSYAF